MAVLPRSPSRTRAKQRATSWIVASCCVHAAAVWAFSRKPAALPAPAFEPTELEIELAASAEPESIEATIRPGAPADPAAPADPGAKAEVASQRANAVVPSAEVGPAETEASAAPAASNGTWSVSAFRAQGIAILPAPSYGGAAAPQAPQPEPAAPAQLSQTGGLREALTAADSARGLGRGGGAISAAHAASGAAPSNGRLVLALTFDASGAAISVQIADRSDADPSWDSYAKAVLAQAKKKPSLVLPPGARGLVVTMSISSSMVLPSGSAPGSSVGVGGDKASGAQGHFDLADLGAQPKKRVSARVVKESVVY